MQNLQITRPSTALKTNQKQDKDWRKRNLNMILIQLLMEQLYHGYLLTMTADSMLLITYHETWFWYISLAIHRCCFVSFSPIWNKDKINYRSATTWDFTAVLFLLKHIVVLHHIFLVHWFSVLGRGNDKMLCAPFCDCVWTVRCLGGWPLGWRSLPYLEVSAHIHVPQEFQGHASPMHMC